MTPWVRRIIIANVVVFCAEMLQPDLKLALAFVPAYILVRPWTVITSMFVHDGFLHILFNMVTFFWFGPRVEERLGGRAFLTLYFVSGIGGALLSLAMPSTRMIPIVGASGAIMGIAMAFARFWPRVRFYLYGLLPVEAWLLILIYVVLDLGGAIGIGGAGIAHFAHLGGAAAGYLYVTLWQVRSPAREWRRKVAAPPPPRVFGDGEQLKRWQEIRLDDLHPVNRDEIIRLRDKVQRSGARSLTPEERATLDRFAGLS